MKILIACEESQTVCKEMRRLGHECYSCDIQEPSGGHPEWHILGDALPILNGRCRFKTMDGTEHEVSGRWDMIIAHPPCTHLCSAGQHWFSRGKKSPNLREDAVDFFMEFVFADCDKIAVENPIGVMSTRYRKPDCIVQPWQFGHPETKATCFWLKGLPALIPTDVVAKPENGWKNQALTASEKYVGFKTRDENGRILSWNDPKTAKIRSKTYLGIAKAMAEQWAGDIRSTTRVQPTGDTKNENMSKYSGETNDAQSGK